MGRKELPWKSGDVFLLPATDGKFAPGLVYKHKEAGR